MIRQNINRYLGFETDEESISAALVRLAWMSLANLALAPLQDLLILDESSRIKLPGTIEGKWL